MTQKRILRSGPSAPDERELAVKQRLKKLAEDKKPGDALNESALKPLLDQNHEEMQRATEAEAALLAETAREEERKRKKAERKKRRRQAGKAPAGSAKPEAGGAQVSDSDSASDASEDDRPSSAVNRKQQPPQAKPQPQPQPQPQPAAKQPQPQAQAQAQPAAAPAAGKPKKTVELYVPRRSLAEEVEDAYVEQVCLSDRVGLLGTAVAETGAELESLAAAVEKLRLENAEMEKELAERTRLEKDVPNLQRRVESLRRELETLDHQRIRARQDFELQTAKKLKPKEEELELAMRVLESRRRDEEHTAREEKQVRDAQEDWDTEKLKLDEAISLYGLDPTRITDDFWADQAPEGFFESENFKKCEASIFTAFEKERKFQMRRVNEELGKLDKTLKLINTDVLAFFINNGMHANYSDDVKALVRRVCAVATNATATKPVKAAPAPAPATAAAPPPPPTTAPGATASPERPGRERRGPGRNAERRGGRGGSSGRATQVKQ